jgi:4-hydroxy-tetrahydrodipicolinate synthase
VRVGSSSGFGDGFTLRLGERVDAADAAGRWQEARDVYRWYTPLLHLDTLPTLVQCIKLADAEVGLGSETVRAPRRPLVGAERERVLRIIRTALATRPQVPAR